MKPRPEQRSLAPAAAPQRHAIHIADLLRMTASLPRRQWADAADVLGYNWYPKDEPAPPPQRQPSKQSDPTEADDLPAAPAPAQADERTEPLFWRVFADRLDPQSSTGEPDWLLQARTAPGPAGCFESSGLLRLPQAAPLVSAGRLARFLRQRLAQPRQGSEIDLDWLVKRLARREPVVALRRQWHPRWPLRLNMVLQTDASLGPLREDLRAVAHQVRRLLGERVRWLECPGGPQRLWDARHRPITLRADGNAVLLLGDAGRYQPSQRVQRDWLAWGERLARTGSRPLLLAPLPLRLLDADTAGAFDVALLDESPRLRLQSSLRPRLAAPSQRGADSASDETTPQQATLDALTGLLAGLSGVEPAMLRLLRRGLKSAGLTHADIGAEVEFIGLPQVEWDGAWCRVKPGHEGRTIAALRALPLAPEAMSHLLTEVDAWSQTLSPLLQAERAQVWRQHWPEAGDAGSPAQASPPSANALQIWAWMAEVLSRPADPAQPSPVWPPTWSDSAATTRAWSAPARANCKPPGDWHSAAFSTVPSRRQGWT